MMKRGVTGVLVFACAFAAAPRASACESDAECKGDRVCDGGKCTSSSSGTSAKKKRRKSEAAPKEASDASSSSTTDASSASSTSTDGASSTSTDGEDAPKPKDTKEYTSGLAFGAGFGYQTAGFGLLTAYYVRALPVLSIVPYAGIGKFPGPDTSPSGYAFGTMVQIGGGRHRLVFDIGYGLAGVYVQRSLGLQSTVTEHVVYGVTGAGGYEYLHSGGFFFRPTFGGTKITNDVVPRERQIVVAISLALGFKIW